MNTVKEVIAEAIIQQINAIKTRNEILNAKMKAGIDLTNEERIELSANSDRIEMHIRELKELGFIN